MAGLIPRIIVLALGAGALGFPDALRLLLEIAGRSPLLDIAICIFVMGVVTAHVLGTMLLARFVRKARTGAVVGGATPGAPATDLFAQMTLVVSLSVAFLVFICLLVASGGLGLLHLIVDLAGKSPIIAVLVIGAAVLPCTRSLLRIFREEDNAHGAAPAARATERFANTTQVVGFTGLSVVAVLLLVVSGGLYAHRGPLVNVSAGVATVVGTMLLARISRKARNAAGSGGGAAPTLATDTRRFGKVASLAVVSFALICLLVTTYAPPEREPDGAKYPCSA